MVGLSGPHSNFKMLSEKVKTIKASTSVNMEPDETLVDDSYNPESTVKVIQTHQKRHFSNREIEDIANAYRSGVTTYELAVKYNCHRRTIAGQLKKQGVNVTIEKLDMEDAIRMYESGSTTKEIAEKYHMADNTVSHRLKMAGVQMRTRWDYLR